MARAELIFLNEREEDLIHQQSIKTLEKIGVKVHSRSVLQLLEEKGARVDYDTMIAKLPEEMVERALETAPKEFALCARNSEQDLPMPSDPYPYATTSGLVINVTDWRTGEYRPSTREDAGEFAKLGDALDAVDFLWTALTAGDVPSLAHGPHELWVTMQNTSKHVQGVTVQSAEDANVQIELAALVAGGRDALRKRPLMSVISCPIAPLAFEEGAIEAQVEFAKAGVPICSMSMSRIREGRRSDLLDVDVHGGHQRASHRGGNSDQCQHGKPCEPHHHPGGAPRVAPHLHVRIRADEYADRRHQLLCARKGPDQHRPGPARKAVSPTLPGVRQRLRERYPAQYRPLQ
jgi:hypothetical protein